MKKKEVRKRVGIGRDREGKKSHQISRQPLPVSTRGPCQARVLCALSQQTRQASKPALPLAL